MARTFEPRDWTVAGWRPAEPSRRAWLVAVVLLHAAAVLAWWQLPTAAVPQAIPLRVMAMIVAPQAAEPPPQVPPRIVAKASPPKSRVPAANPVIAAHDVVPAFVPLPEAPSPSFASPSIVAADPTPIVVAAAPAPPPVVAPRFDAAYLDNAPPAYPTIARQAREQGVVMLQVRVSPAGMPDAVEIRQSSGSVRLDEAARQRFCIGGSFPHAKATLP